MNSQTFQSLTKSEKVIVKWVEAKHSFQDFRSRADKQRAISVAMELGIEEVSENVSLFVKETFDSMNASIHKMYDAIMESLSAKDAAPEVKVEVVANAVENTTPVVAEEIADRIIGQIVDDMESSKIEAETAKQEADRQRERAEAAELEAKLLREAQEEAAATFVPESDDEMEAEKKAEEYNNSAKDKMERAAKYTMEHIKSASEVVSRFLKDYNNFANMTNDEIEEVLRDKGGDLFEKIKRTVVKHKSDLKVVGQLFDTTEEQKETDDVILIFQEIMDDENLGGWGKFKRIVGMLVRCIIRIFIKVFAVLFKVAITIAVGIIKIGAITLDTAFRTGKVVNKEIIKPVYTSSKEAYNRYKVNKENKTEEERRVKEEEDNFANEAENLSSDFNIIR